MSRPLQRVAGLVALWVTLLALASWGTWLAFIDGSRPLLLMVGVVIGMCNALTVMVIGFNTRDFKGPRP